MKKKVLKLTVMAAAFGMCTFMGAGREAVYAADSITGYPEYDEIVQKYRDGMASNWDMGMFQDNGLCYLAGYETDMDKLGYFVSDINGDGVEDLLVGSLNNEGNYLGMFYDLYTMVDGKRVQVITSGERDRYYLCEDQTIANEGSGSAWNSIWRYMDFTSGQLVLKESVFTDGYYHPENPWFYTTMDSFDDYSNPISEDEGRSVIAKYVYKDIPYTPLSQSRDQSAGSSTQVQTPKEQATQEVDETEKKAEAIETELSQDLNLSQTEIKEKLNDLYKLWDDSLNSVWGYLKANLSTEAMDALTQEEIDWIADKEQDMAAAEKQSEEDALTTAIDRTQERVYYLLDRLQ